MLTRGILKDVIYIRRKSVFSSNSKSRQAVLSLVFSPKFYCSTRQLIAFLCKRAHTIHVFKLTCWSCWSCTFREELLCKIPQYTLPQHEVVFHNFHLRKVRSWRRKPNQARLWWQRPSMENAWWRKPVGVSSWWQKSSGVSWWWRRLIRVS